LNAKYLHSVCVTNDDSFRGALVTNAQVCPHALKAFSDLIPPPRIFNHFQAHIVKNALGKVALGKGLPYCRNGGVDSNKEVLKKSVRTAEG
jgi:hypothetical protein